MNKLDSIKTFGALAALTVSWSANAVPVHATFSGAVTGSTSFFTTILSVLPAGTAASFDVTFDDSGLLPTAPLTDFDLAPVSGWLKLGALEYSITGGAMESYSYSILDPTNPILSYGLHLTGTGPSLGGSTSLYGLFMRLTPSLDLFSTGAPLSVAFAFPRPGGEIYSYADLGGAFSATRGIPVPEPSTALLMLPMLAVFLRSRIVKRNMLNA